LIIIFLGHKLWNCLKDTYSTKKTKDLVNTQITKYKKIMKEMEDNSNSKNFLNFYEKQNMDRQLTQFLENINNNEKLI
jgi:hypothetical protein